MTSMSIYIFMIFVSIIGLIFRRSLLYLPISILQLSLGINNLLGEISIGTIRYIIIALILTIIIFIYAITILIIKYRSTVYINELTKLRG